MLHWVCPVHLVGKDFDSFLISLIVNTETLYLLLCSLKVLLILILQLKSIFDINIDSNTHIAIKYTNSSTSLTKL